MPRGGPGVRGALLEVTSAPAHSPVYLWPVQPGWVPADWWNPARNLDHSRQRAARHAPRVTLGLVSLVPSERAGTALWTAMAGHRSSDISDNTFLSPLLLYLILARAEDVVTKEIKNLSCDSRPLCPSIGHL